MAYDARQVANRMIELAQSDGRDMDIMTLLKLVYFAHGWCLAILDRALITDQVEAWKHGPVVPSVYYMFRRQGISGLQQIDLLVDPIDDEADEIIQETYQKYIKSRPFKLSKITHEKNGPWDKIYNTFGRGHPIPNELIKEHFEWELEFFGLKEPQHG